MKIRGIVNRKVKDGVTMYKVKYKGDKEDTWLTADEVDKTMVDKFEAKRAGKLDKQPQEEKQVKQEKRPLESTAEKPAKSVKSSASDDASSASAAPAPAPAPADLRPSVFTVMRKYLEKYGIETLTKKKVRRLLEQELGVAAMSLEGRKPEIGAATDAYIEQHLEQQNEEDEEEQEAGGDDTASDSGAESSESEDEEEAKKAPVKKAIITLKTKSGAEAPKNVAKQQGTAMKVKYFEEHAEPLTVDVLGNKVTAEPRSFSSGNRGWYLGGKIEVTVGKKKLWAQLGLNLTIPGSKEWR